MTIRKNENWGSTVARPKNLAICKSDADASQLVTECHVQKRAFPAIAISKSNLARALGSSGAKTNAPTMQVTPFDLIEITFVDSSNKGQTVLALGYGLLRKSWWRGEIMATMNTSFIGDWDCAPRSHPNDGKFDLVTVNAEMNLTQRLIASRRLRLATHLPHPQISVKQLTSFDADCFSKPDLYVDGHRFSGIKHCKFRLVADAITLYW